MNKCEYCGKPYRTVKIKFGAVETEIDAPSCDCNDKTIDERRARQHEESRRRAHLDAGACFEMDDQKNRTASELAKRYTNHFGEILNRGEGLFLYGGIGTGKSFLAGCIGNELFDKGYSVEFVNMDALVTEATANFGENREQVMNRLNKTDLFILDDFGVERSTEYMNEKVFSLIDARYQSKKPTIVTSNFRPDELRRTADFAKRRIYSRVLEMCCGCIELHGEDRRDLIGNEKTGRLKAVLEGNE